MTLQITEHRMSTDGLDIVARRLPGGRWIVTGCGTRVFTRAEAITALTLAKALASAPPPDSFLWLHIRAWKRALGYPIHPSDGPHWPSLAGSPVADALPSADPTNPTSPDGSPSAITDQGATAIPPRTSVAPCHPATLQEHEVTSS